MVKQGKAPHIKPLKSEVYSRFMSQTGNHRSALKDNTGNSQYDIIGTLLKGELLNIPTLITFNRNNNTYYEGYNGTLISEAELAFGVFKDLTTNGLSRIESLRRFYEKKMPERLRDLQRKFRAGDRYIPNTQFEGVNLPVATHSITIDPKAPTDEDITLYDLDVLRAIASTEDEDGDEGEGLPIIMQSMLPEIDGLRSSFMQYGLNLVPVGMDVMEGDLPQDDQEDLINPGQGRSYILEYGQDPLAHAIDSEKGMDDFSNILNQALNAGGWEGSEYRFPIPSGSEKVWHFQNKKGNMFASLDGKTSRVVFKT